jgi:hypothetical protein
MKKTIIILFGVLLLTSCLKDEVPFQYIIRVSVTDYEGNPIKDVDIMTLKFSKTGRSDFPYTYNNGYYEFTNLMDTGAYEVWVEKKGNIYKPGQGRTTLKENKIEPVNIKLEKR